MSGSPLSDVTLCAIPLLRGMNASERRQIAEISSIVAFVEGATILHEGRSTHALWILLEGRCEVTRQGDGVADASIQLAVLEPYNNFGEMSFFNPAPHSATVRAISAVRAVRIDRSDYDELVELGSSAANKLCCNAVESLAQRLRRMDQWVAELLSRDNGTALGANNASPPRVEEWANFRQKLLSDWTL